MLGAYFNQLQELQFELYVAKQIKDYSKTSRIKKKIKEIEEKIKNEKGEK